MILLLAFQYPISNCEAVILNKHTHITKMSLQYSPMNYNSSKSSTLGELISQNYEIHIRNNHINFYGYFVYYNMMRKW